MRKFVAVYAALLVSGAIGGPIPSQAETMVSALEIPGLHTKAADGVYDQIFARISELTGVSIKATPLPPGRAIAQFEAGEIDCLSPADSDFYNMSGPSIQSKPMNLAKVFIYTKKGSAPVSSLDALAGKRVGGRQGMPYGEAVDKATFKFLLAPTIEANIKKLEAGRIDAFLAYVPDAWDAFSAMGMDELPHDPNSPVVIHEDSILCYDKPVTRALIAQVDAAIDQLRDEAVLKEILGGAYIPD